ncbi:MAG: hypothetical protein J6Y84_06400 [Bacteroidaceae bacterium]|nr:hypothetical protein [Bacteroidaceae bacterium]
MKTSKKIPNIPKEYLRCFNDSCVRAESCLRHIAAKQENTTEETLSVVNPALNSGTSCKFFRPDTTVRMAYGMQHSFDKVLAKDIAAMRKAFLRQFSNSSYYRRRNGQIPISPEEQEFICGVFRSFGYSDENIFDRYEEETAW